MDFDSWTSRRVDTLRVRRLLVGWVVGAISVTLALAFIILTGKGTAAAEEEDDGPIEVSLAKEAEPPPPPPPPPPHAASVRAAVATNRVPSDMVRMSFPLFVMLPAPKFCAGRP